MNHPVAEPSTAAARLSQALHQDGIAGVPGALPARWADELLEDWTVLFEEARGFPGGTVNRGTNRFYFTVHPERLRGFLDLVTHPVVTSVSTEVLGPDYRVVEVAFDVPLPASRDQPWHRDFEMSAVERDERRLASLAFNLTAVDVTPDMGPFEVAPGTQWDDGSRWEFGMFPDPRSCERFETLRQQRMPRRGDMSVRTGLTVHRGTANRSDLPRPVLILGVVAPEVDPGPHGLELSASYAASLTPEVLRHLHHRVVDELRPLVQTHTIEGLVMGD
jgi:hypothetical protein